MEESILTSVKKMLGMPPEYTAYDEDVTIAINTVFSTCYQLGVGPENPYYISGSTEKWSDFTEDRKTIEMIKTYMFMKVKLIFDPPLNSSVLESYTQMAKEYEWRLHVADDVVRHYVPEEDARSEDIYDYGV